MEPAAAASRSGSTVAFSWEHEPGVSKQSSPVEDRKPAAEAPGAEASGRRTPASAKKAPAAVTAHPHRLRVPPPPGGPGAPAVSPPARTKSRSRGGGVQPRDDPFLAAYLACTEKGGGEHKWAQRLLGWAGLGLGLGLRGFGLSCKSSCGAVERCVVRLAKIPEDHED